MPALFKTTLQATSQSSWTRKEVARLSMWRSQLLRTFQNFKKFPVVIAQKTETPAFAARPELYLLFGSWYALRPYFIAVAYPLFLVPKEP
jgi:hypothetical protein